jgi:hypothetical protein
MDGIYTLANDHVLDQTIALINSIEAIMGQGFPICIFPYDDHLEQLTEAIKDRPQVQIFADQAVLAYWDEQARRVWDCHPKAKVRWAKLTSDPYYRFGTHRRFGAFSGPFDKFLYMDADTLLLDDVTPIFDRLETHDLVVYDFQHSDITHVYNDHSPKLLQVFPQARLDREIFCSGFYAAKRGTFSQGQLDAMIDHLQTDDEADILYAMAPDQTVLNYWVMRSNLKVCNLAFDLPQNAITGCCVTSPHFEVRDNFLAYDRGNRLIYLHYIGLSSGLFRRVCNEGENIRFPYRDLFLHYRYLHAPETAVKLTGPATAYDAPLSLAQRFLRKLQLTR